MDQQAQARGRERNFESPNFDTGATVSLTLTERGLDTVVTDVRVGEEGKPVDHNPCVECRLCAAACPVGAISEDGHYNFVACYTHTYRDAVTGFTDWVETIAQSRDARDYRARVSDSESLSMWQSLAVGPNYKSAYCMAVCPAGDDVLAPYVFDKARYTREIVRPLQHKKETVYVMAGSDAEAHVQKRFPQKATKRVRSGLRWESVQEFLRTLPLGFQPRRAAGIRVRYHFSFVGDEKIDATIAIDDGKLAIAGQHEGNADLHVTADARTWLGFVHGERSLLWAVLMRKVRWTGRFTLLRLFNRCFKA